MPVSLSSDDRVRVIAGAYTGWEGEVMRVETNPERVTVEIRVFGKVTVIKLRLSEVQPV